MNNKKTVSAVVIVAIVAIVIGFGAWFLQHPTAPTGGTTPVASSTPSSSVATSSSTPTSSVTVTVTPEQAPTSTSWQPSSNKTVQISFSIPPGWAIGPDQPISLDNFNHQYQNDSIIPMGGAEIGVASKQYYGTMSDLIKYLAVNGTVNSTTSVAVNGILCTEVFHSSTYAPGYPSSNVAVYCSDAANGLLYEMDLSYRTGDPKSAQFITTFENFLNRVQFAGQ